jgi:hypothetical protein
MDRNTGRPVHESCRFPGHDDRMADHARRARSTPCECGSGRPYGDCCMDADHQRSSAQVSYSLPASIHRSLSARCDIEDHLRIRAFNTFYRVGHEQLDLSVRFVRAIVASAGPIRDQQQVRNWHRLFRKRRPGKGREARR